MSYMERKSIIGEIENQRHSRVITLIISDRYSTFPLQGIQAQIASDQVHKIVQHVREISNSAEPEKIDLFIYSRGGDVNSAWPMVNSIRNYCKSFSAIVPLHALSAATLICLGADTIVMSKSASLSPIDPTVANAFNPKDAVSGQPLGISVEDVASFFSLAKDKNSVDLKSESSITEVFKLLAQQVHPLALGNVKRSHSQIRHLARKLLTLHIKEDSASKKIDAIVDELTERFYTHNHSIFREEAKNIGLDNIILDATPEEERLLWKLYEDYEKDMQLKTFFDPMSFLGEDAEKVLETTPVFIESTCFSSAFNFKQKIKKVFIQDPQFRLQVIAQNEQNSNVLRNTKLQLTQLEANFANFMAQIAGMIQKNQTDPNLQRLNNICTTVYNDIRTLLNSVPNALNMDDLKKQMEFEMQSIGWVDSRV